MVFSRALMLPASFAAVLLIAAPTQHAAAAEAAQRSIVINGEGEVSAKPDSARLSAGVLSQAPTAAAALTANTTAMNQVFAALRAAGIPDNKIQTSNFSVQPQYAPYREGNPQPQRIVGYQVTNQVGVVVDDLSKLGPTLDALVRSGSNQLGGIAFFIANPKPMAERARAAAVADAMAKARTLAGAAGVTLGPVMTIQESTSFRPVPMYAMARLAADAGPPPVASGEESVSVNVTMTYAIQ